MKPLSRRHMLRGLLAGSTVTLGLPALEIFAGRRAHAATSLLPRRFGVFFWGNGNLPFRWTPTGEGTEWSQFSVPPRRATGRSGTPTIPPGCSRTEEHREWL